MVLTMINIETLNVILYRTFTEKFRKFRFSINIFQFCSKKMMEEMIFFYQTFDPSFGWALILNKYPTYYI